MRRTRSTYAVATMAAGLTLSLTLAACSGTDDTTGGTRPPPRRTARTTPR